jgi:hypothetical protein
MSLYPLLSLVMTCRSLNTWRFTLFNRFTVFLKCFIDPVFAFAIVAVNISEKDTAHTLLV